MLSLNGLNCIQEAPQKEVGTTVLTFRNQPKSKKQVALKLLEEKDSREDEKKKGTQLEKLCTKVSSKLFIPGKLSGASVFSSGT